MKLQGPIVLASASPRRKELLDRIGIPTEVVPSDIAEVGYGGDPALIPQRITTQKVKAVSSRLGGAFSGWILGADTVVALGQECMGKPQDENEAFRMLKALSNREHFVYTAFRVQGFDGDYRESTVLTKVHFRKISDEELKWYLGSDEWRDKAGAYGIQGKAGVWVHRIDGSYTNVVGLPICEVVLALAELGAIQF